ncbi:MAG: COX15/CtaA family protein [Flavobacterium stagni]
MSLNIEQLYRRIGLLACSSVFLLFLLGGLVRATGSGMGCPDWPKCFGLLAPPTCDCDLPPNYQAVFLEKRLKKVDRFASFLEKLGMEQSAERLRTDPSIRVPEEFNPIKAWIEYINRLFGVLSGLFGLAWIVLVFIRQSLKKYRFWVTIGFVFLLVNAWLGSLVVATNLIPGIVSLHYLLSFVCLFSMIKAYLLSVSNNWVSTWKEKQLEGSSYNRNRAVIFWIISWVVVTLGTWSREQTEILRVAGSLISDRDSILNLSGMGWVFVVHRYVPGLLFLVLLSWVYKQNKVDSVDFRSPECVLLITAFLQIILGAIQVVYVLPMWSQVMHIVLGSAFVTLGFIWAISEHHQLKHHGSSNA